MNFLVLLSAYILKIRILSSLVIALRLSNLFSCCSNVSVCILLLLVCILGFLLYILTLFAGEIIWIDIWRDMEAEAKRRKDARRQQTRPRSHDYDRYLNAQTDTI